MRGRGRTRWFNPFLACGRRGDRLARLMRGPWRIPLFGATGLLVGLGLLAFQVSNARSYLSDAPETCLNCHVMAPYYASWAHGSHRQTATCGDCHVPHDNPLRAVFFKMMDGMRHAAVFTLRAEPQVLRLNEAAVPVVQQNCLRCHGAMIVGTNMDAPDRRGNCWDCHREVPHGRTLSLSATPHARRPALPSAGMPVEKARPAGVPETRKEGE